MGQIRTAECEKIDSELRQMCGVDVETQKDTYSEDYMVWVTVDDAIQPIRITVDEYADGSWRDNVRQAIELLKTS
jgi:hypothetical protein